RTPQGTATVMVVGQDNKVALRTVRTGALVDGFWLVDDGLKAGERVIVSGVQKLRPGTVVRVAAAPAAAAPAAAAPAAATTARQE
ncbi:MAG: efflux transporter periplasmic adaptor subunit, partial [Massilia sp.]